MDGCRKDASRQNEGGGERTLAQQKLPLLVGGAQAETKERFIGREPRGGKKKRGLELGVHSWVPFLL